MVFLQYTADTPEKQGNLSNLESFLRYKKDKKQREALHMDFFDDVFGTEECSAPEHPVFQSLFVSEEHALKILSGLEEPIPHRDAGRCLHKALQDCSEELFRQVLNHCAQGEAVEHTHMPFHQMGWGIQGCGSMLLLAAMMDRPKQATMLLKKGYDCNGAGLNLADSLQRDGKCWGEGIIPYSRYSGSSGCHVNILRPNQRLLGISCATPLSAALLCGSLSTAEVLLRCDGIWKGESTAVCRAAVMILEGITRETLSKEQQSNQLEILRQIFCPEAEHLPDRETFLRSVYLQPSCFVDFCRTDTLRRQLESGLCSERDAREMLDVLGNNLWRIGEYDRKRAGKLLLIKQHFPKLCREAWVKGIFLREVSCRARKKLPYQTVLNAWKQLSGKERDLTFIGNDLWTFGGTKLSRFLQEAGEDGTLVMDADAMNQWYGASARCMLEVLKQVQFRQRGGEGVNGMIQHLLYVGNLRTLRQAAKHGLLEREDPKQLLECLAELNNCNQDLRAAALTFARNHKSPEEMKANWQDPHRWNQWCLWEVLRDEDAEELLHGLLYGKLSREECLRIMFRMHQHLDRGVFAPDMNLRHPQYPALQADSLAGFACCAEHGQMLELLLESLPEKLQGVVRVDWGKRFGFRGTPLALAAAMGRTEQVRLLLDRGFQPDEEGRGDVSRFFTRQSDFSETGFPVTPLLAAILFGQEETAKLLLERGAACDFSRPEHRTVLLKGSAESLRLAERLPNVGFEKIPDEELEAMRIMTSGQGERTLFWDSLRQKPMDSE